MLQIKNTLGGGKPEGLYAWKKHEIGNELKIFNKSVSTLPYSFFGGCAVVLNGEIHILGSDESSCYTRHFKWNGTSWVSVSTLPYNFRFGSAVVLDGEIHILGSADNEYTYKYHYKWNGSSWVSVSTLPVYFYYGSAVVLNGEIHILGCKARSLGKIHYKWDGSSWTSVSTLPYDFYKGSAVVLDNEIHILGGDGGLTNHYKFDGSSWTSVSTLPYQFRGGSVVVLDNEIHILGGNGGLTNHYKFDGSSWTSVSTLPYQFRGGSVVIFDNGIHILGTSNASDYYKAHYLIIGNVPVYTFIDYIVSDKETAYPDGGEKGGYWYERVVEGVDLSKLGCTGYYEGSITPTSSATNPSLPIPSGIIPKWILLYVEDKKAASGLLYACVQKIAEEVNSYGNYYVAYGGSTSKGVGNTDYNTFNGGNSQISAPNTTVKLISANFSLDTVKYNYLVLY